MLVSPSVFLDFWVFSPLDFACIFFILGFVLLLSSVEFFRKDGDRQRTEGGTNRGR